MDHRLASHRSGACARGGDPLGALNRVALRDDAPARVFTIARLARMECALRAIEDLQYGRYCGQRRINAALRDARTIRRAGRG